MSHNVPNVDPPEVVPYVGDQTVLVLANIEDRPPAPYATDRREVVLHLMGSAVPLTSQYPPPFTQLFHGIRVAAAKVGQPCPRNDMHGIFGMFQK